MWATMIGFWNECWHGGRDSLFLGPRVRRLHPQGWIVISASELRVRTRGGRYSMVTGGVREGCLFKCSCQKRRGQGIEVM